MYFVLIVDFFFWVVSSLVGIADVSENLIASVFRVEVKTEAIRFSGKVGNRLQDYTASYSEYRNFPVNVLYV